MPLIYSLPSFMVGTPVDCCAMMSSLDASLRYNQYCALFLIRMPCNVVQAIMMFDYDRLLDYGTTRRLHKAMNRSECKDGNYRPQSIPGKREHYSSLSLFCSKSPQSFSNIIKCPLDIEHHPMAPF
uniref:Uncharacterized protein n=1 Tax=Tanacetum cinerariifolium TaxID=118510 RepID=A0A699HRP1_TANCI|nr:hypothetical protein [Tanacetum cinerariifolium]